MARERLAGLKVIWKICLDIKARFRSSIAIMTYVTSKMGQMVR